MTTFQLNLIFDGLKPIFTQCKAVAISACLLSPIALSTPVLSQENKPVQIHSIHNVGHKLTETEKISLTHLANHIISLIDTINPFIDFASQIAYDNGSLIPDADLSKLEQKIMEFQENTQQIKQKMYQSEWENAMLIDKLSVFGQKITTFCNIVKSVKYKSMSDEVITNRLYQGIESVGYSYSAEHSFDDFKKAMMM